MTQLRLPLPRTYVPVTLGCPACGHEWVSAMIVIGRWWAETPARIATRPYCRRCHCKPPMIVVTRKEVAA